MVQLVANRDRPHVHQPNTTLVPTTIHVNTSLPTYVPRGFVHQPLNGRQVGDSLGGSSLKGDPPRGPPFNPPVRSYGWPALESCMFIPPWYQELLCNLYQNQQPSYHTKVISKTLIVMLRLECSRRPLKLMVKQWKLTSSTCLVLLPKIVSLNGVIFLFKTIQIAFLKNWNKHFANVLEL